MRKQFLKITAVALSGALVLGLGEIPVSAASSAGITGYTSSMLITSALPTAGVSLAFSNCMAQTQEAAVLAGAKAIVSENDTPTVASEYADMAVAQVNDYVNVRSEASEEGEVLGKLYNNSVATVLEESNGWYKISSGSVEGYVKSEFVVVGDEQLIENVGERLATVNAETLRVRTEANEGAKILGLVPQGDDLSVVDESFEGWVGVSIEEGTGYVSADYVTVNTEYTYAESKAEEEARLAREQADREAAAAAAAQASSSSSSKKSKKKKATGAQSYSAPSGSTGQDVADFAVQFVGNPYVYGGTSLTDGADCSGFVMAVYKEFGVTLPHSSRSMRSVGTSVSTKKMKAGDIVCYSGHVGIYIGGNSIVHASTPSSGIKISSPANYKKILAVRRIL